MRFSGAAFHGVGEPINGVGAKAASPTGGRDREMAAATMITLPVFALALSVRRYIVRGVVAGAVLGRKFAKADEDPRPATR